MKRFLPWIIGIGLVIIVAFWVMGLKNTALKYNQAVGKEWGNVGNGINHYIWEVGSSRGDVKGDKRAESIWERRVLIIRQ